MSSSTSSSPAAHAIVLGGSIAGLLAARALVSSKRFDRITVLERDAIPTKDDPTRTDPTKNERAGVPHARHLHVLLRRGLLTFDDLIPGFERDLEARGAVRINAGREFFVMLRTGWAPRVDTDVYMLAFSRALLESTLRERVLTDDARVITLRDGVRVRGLMGLAGKVVGVRTSDGEELLADFVIDATGRRSQASEWLHQLGYERPPEKIVDASWGYATRIYKKPAAKAYPWKQLFIMNRPPNEPRGGVLQSIEGDRWLLSLAGVMGDHPPTDEAGFLEFARTLPSKAIYEAVKDAEPLCAPYGFRNTENRLRSFDQLKRFPARFCAIGDAVCALTPVYAQGLTLAGLEALAIRELAGTTASLDDLGQAVQRRTGELVAGGFALATSEDSRWPNTVGAVFGPKTRLIHKYLDHVIALAPHTPEIYRTFIEVQHMVRPRSALFSRPVLGRVLQRAVGIRRLPPHPAPEPELLL
jgi:2-polyprenyl-6-methoxyphenol hydroxylase-like FAD-dependent oxidoreductase